MALPISRANVLTFHGTSGAPVYYLRRCLYGYGDEECVSILTQLSNAMEPDSTLLIVEAVQGDPPSAVAADMGMLMITIAGKQQTLDRFRAITSPAGLDITHACTEHGVEGAVIECARKAASSRGFVSRYPLLRSLQAWYQHLNIAVVLGYNF